MHVRFFYGKIYSAKNVLQFKVEKIFEFKEHLQTYLYNYIYL